VKKIVVSPLYDRLLVHKIEAAEKTAGGIIMPETAKQELNRGTIVAAGRGKMLEDGTVIPLSVKVGDEIIFGRYSGQDIEVDGKKVFTMREDEIIGIIHTVDDGIEVGADPAVDGGDRSEPVGQA
jgi:chaperonin GroES